MNGKLGPFLWMACGGLFIAIMGLVAWSAGWLGSPGAPSVANGDERRIPPDPVADRAVAKPGDKEKTADLPNPPQRPKEVPNTDRVKQNLKVGKTYVTKVTGYMKVRAEDTDYAVKKMVFINYTFQALIDREIEKNDGKTIVELRHFRDVRSVRVQSELEDLRIDLDSVGDGMLSAIPGVQGFVKRLSGLSMKPALKLLRRANQSPEEFLGLDKTGDIAATKLNELSKTIKAVTTMDSLSGKAVRLTYVNGKGVELVQPVTGTLTFAEREFHRGSVLLSDSLLVPDMDVRIGDQWQVDGSNFGNFIDPSLLSRTKGEIVMEREKNMLVHGRKCLHLKVVDGTLHFEDWNPQAGTLGFFSPRGSMYFSPDDQIVIEAKLQGSANLKRFSNNHLLFKSELLARPELELRYSCSVIDTAK